MKICVNMSKLLCLLLSLGLIISCKSEQIGMQDYTVERDIYLSINQEFIYDLGNSIPTEGGFSIKNQAKHFETNEIIINSDEGIKLQYVYKPSLDFKGDDFVILQNCISIGGADCDKIELFKFRFHIK